VTVAGKLREERHQNWKRNVFMNFEKQEKDCSSCGGAFFLFCFVVKVSPLLFISEEMERSILFVTLLFAGACVIPSAAFTISPMQR
jgi:hypothetical protein